MLEMHRGFEERGKGRWCLEGVEMREGIWQLLFRLQVPKYLS